MARILVAEDSPTQAAEIQCILESAGYEVEVAQDGRKALAALAASTYDLVVSDVVMPGLTGYEVCRWIKDDPSLKHLPVTLLTSLSDPLDIIRGLECGADHFLTKPCEPSALLERVGTILDNKALRKEDQVRAGAELVFMGKKLVINSDKEQILNLLVSTFENIIGANLRLQKTQEELRAANAKIDEYARRLEERVQSSETKYHCLLEQANDAVLLLDLSGVVVEANRRAEEMLGLPVAEIFGRPFESFAVTGELAHALVPQLLAKGSVRTDSLYLKRAAGGWTCVDCSASLVEAGGERVALVIAHDITERCQAEESLRQSEERLRQALKMEAIGRLAGGVAHDFNNLLTVIIGHSELLLRASSTDATARESVEEIRRAAERAAELTGQLLAFSRKQILAPQVLSLNAVVADMEKMLRRLIGEDIQTGVVLDPSVLPVRADSGQIEQVLMNLAVNARDAMPRGGNLTIETANAVLDENYGGSHPGVTPGRYSMIAVSDTGCGMDAATLARIFEPFFTTKGTGQGTGLGLASVYGIVQQSGGHIYVYSEPGSGTTFKVYLPALDGPAPSGKSFAGTSTMSVGTETILLVEDEESVRTLGRHVLEICGYTVLAAADGKEAVGVCERHGEKIHLLVSDVIMPHLGGRDLAERLALLKPEMKVLFVSGYTDDVVVRHGILEAKTAFLQKPYTPGDLARKVRQVLDAQA